MVIRMASARKPFVLPNAKLASGEFNSQMHLDIKDSRSPLVRRDIASGDLHAKTYFLATPRVSFRSGH